MQVWEVHFEKEPESHIEMSVSRNELRFAFFGDAFKKCRAFSGLVRAEDAFSY